MAQGKSGKHVATAFVFGFPPSSQHQVKPAIRGEATGMLGAVVWAVGLTLGSLANAVVFLDVSALSRWSRAVDGPGLSWASAVLGYALIANSARFVQPDTSSRRLRPLSALALVAWTYHLLLLRWPWLTATVDPSARLTVYAGALSRSWGSLPLFAFGELLAQGLLFTHATLYLLSAARRNGGAFQSGNPSYARLAVVFTSLAFYFLSAAVTINLATGRY